MKGSEYLELFTAPFNPAEVPVDDKSYSYYLLKGAYSSEPDENSEFSSGVSHIHEATKNTMSFWGRSQTAVDGLIKVMNNRSSSSTIDPLYHGPRIESSIEGIDYADGISQLYEGTQIASAALIAELLSKGRRDLFRSPNPTESGDKEVLSNAKSHISISLAARLAACATTLDYEWVIVDGKVESVGVNTTTLAARHFFESEDLFRKDDVGAAAAGQLVEVDAYFALTEWVRKNKLPYIPVMTPREIERGPQNRVDDKNAHSDILLVGIGNDDIVPIQGKFSDKYIPSDYIDEMVFLTGADMTTPKASEQIVAVKEIGNLRRNTVGFRTRGVLGEVSKSLINFDNNRRGSKQKKSRKNLDRILNHAMNRLDDKVLPKLGDARIVSEGGTL